MTLPAQLISISVDRSADDVYEFASKGENLPLWASGLSGGTIKKSGDDWIADSPMGEITIRFAPKNAFGVMDHDVTLESGEIFHNPMRVVPNGDGSEISFTLFRQPNVSGEDFAKDAETITKDLEKLKTILEKSV